MAQMLSFGKKSAFIGALQGGIGKKSKIYFVDGLNGGDGGTYAVSATSPDHSFKSVGKAIGVLGTAGVADAFDVVYVLDRGTAGTTDPDPYVETGANLVIPVTSQNLKLVGCPTSLDNPFMIQIKGHASATTPVLTNYAPMVSIENLSFNRGASTSGGIYLADEGDGVYSAQGTTISNCHFKNLRGSAAAATSTGGGVVIRGGWNYLIKNSFFDDCRVGVWIDSGSASTVKWLRILGCHFAGTKTNRDVDIYMAGVCYSTEIDQCILADQPAYGGTGASALYAILVGDGMINAKFGCLAAATFGAAGNAAHIPTTFFMAGCTKEAGAVART